VQRKQSLFINLILGLGLILLVSLGVLAGVSILYVKEAVTDQLMAEADRFGDTVKLGTRYAMMDNVRGDIMKIIENIARRKDVERLRIFHKDGRIRFSSTPEEIDRFVNIRDYACRVCHRHNPPPKSLPIRERVRFFSTPDGQRHLGIISPIYNEAGCSSASCHAHSAATTVLGILDIVVSMDQVDREVGSLERTYGLVAALIFLVTALLVARYLFRFVTRPVQKMIEGTQMIASGQPFDPGVVHRDDEMGRLARAIGSMGTEILRQREELLEANRELQHANRELEDRSHRDPLTGLFNRRYLVKVFSRELERARRYGHPLSVLMLDVDHFKQVNDRYGHLCGDAVLQGLADVLGKSVRATDVIARYGGEEVVVLLLETALEKAVAIAEKIRLAIAAHHICCEEARISVTVSIGVAAGPTRETVHCTDLLDAADQAMYQAKAGGRNRVVPAGMAADVSAGEK